MKNNELKWEKLTWSNYKELDTILNNDYNEPFSFLTYLSWEYYGIQIFFAKYNDSILLMGKIQNGFDNVQREGTVNEEIINHDIKQMIFRPFFKNDNLIDLVNICIEHVEDNQKILLENFYENDIDILNIKKILWTWDSNYIYTVDQLKYFKGKSLQKKRNLLNFFNKTYLELSKIDKLTQDNIHLFLKFMNEPNEKITYQNHEIAFYNDMVKNFDFETMSGSILFYKEEIIGITISYLRNDYYEIYIEKCVKDIKGAFQYLLSQNLIINNINSKYVDRQDGASMQNLIKSKESYKPIKIYTRNAHLIDAKKIH